MTRLAAALACLLQFLIAIPVCSHELRPAYLEIRETSTDTFAITWKVPALGDRRLSLDVRLPDACTNHGEVVSTFDGTAHFARWSARCPGSLEGLEITIEGLRATLTDVLVRIANADGSTQIARLTPEAPTLVVTVTQTAFEVASTYFVLGVDHILSGFDHLLFVAALMLLIHERWMLVKTITAFTVAHSITLAGAALGYLSLPQKPVEAVIALSIAFVAYEVVKSKPTHRRRAESYPWLVAFAFGLLHGFGFAGALREIGLPQTDVPIALLTFNLGVEAGQLLFVAGVLGSYKAITALVTVPMTSARLAIAYGIGTVATFWFLTRVNSFWS